MTRSLTHIHHILPKHMGGTDDPSNLVELSIHDHAEAHKWLFIEFGKVQDALAWLSLYRQLSNQEVLRELARLGGRNGGIKLKGKPKSDAHRANLKKPHKSFKMSENTKLRMRKPKSDAHKEAIRKSKLGLKNPMKPGMTNAGSIKPGEHRSPATEFKKKVYART